MKKIWYKDREKMYLVAVMTIYTILACIIVFTHEPFRDEAQAWLIARDTNIFEMFSLSKYEGSPMLWHVLVNVLTTLRLPYISINIMHLILNLIAVYLLNKYAPFNKYVKLVITFSHMMLYQYLAIARSYILVSLLLFVIAIVYKERHKNTLLYSVLLLLLQNVCLYSIPIAITLFITYIVEKIKMKEIDKKSIIIFAMIAMLMLGTLMLLVKPAKETSIYSVKLPKNIQDFVNGALKALESIGFVLLPIEELRNTKIVLGLLLLLFTTISLWNDKKVMIIFLISTIVMGGITAFLNINICYRHVYLYIVIYIFACWICRKLIFEQIFAVATVGCFSMMQISLLIIYSTYDITNMYSNSKYIFENILSADEYKGYKIFAFEGPYASSVLPYLPEEKMLLLNDYENYTYIIWKNQVARRTNSLDINGAIYYAVTKYDGKVLFIGDEYIPEIATEKLELIYPHYKDTENEGEMIEEELYVYKLKGK